MNKFSIVALIILVFAIAVGGRECGAKTKRKTRAGSSEWVGVIAPSNLNAVGVSASQINLSWQDNSINEDGFYIERKTESDGVYIQVGTTGVDVNSLLDSNNLCPGNTYYYRVRAFMTTGDISNYSNEASLLLSQPISSLNTGINCFYVSIGPNLPLWGCGWNEYYQITLGVGTTNDINLPIRIGVESDWALIYGGIGHQIGLKTNGIVWSWGYNSNGQLGLGDQDNKNIPVMIESDFYYEEFAGISEVSAGLFSSFAKKTDGTVWAWGNNVFGQLGSGDFEDTTAPLQVGTNSDWDFIRAGSYHTIARKTNNTLWGWGDNWYGQLALGSMVGQSTLPIQISSDTDWLDVSPAAGDFTIAIKNNRTIWGWGCSIFGSLGAGDSSIPLNKIWTPSQIGSDSDWSAISAGYLHSLAKKTNNTLWAWGVDWLGQLGIGITYFMEGGPGAGGGLIVPIPVQIGSDTDWDKFVASNAFSIASKIDGSIWAWGDNWNGELGLGDTIDRWTPTRIRFGVPNAPSSLTAMGVSINQINLSWVDNSSDEIAFKVERKTGITGTYVQIGLSSASITSYADATASPFDTYYYRVRAHNVYGNGPYSAEISATSIQTVPSTPAVLTATAVTSTIINLVWDDVIGEIGYKIERSSPLTATYAEIGMANADITGYSDTTVDPVTTYYYRLKAYNSIGESGYSPEATTTTPFGPPNIPGFLAVSVISATRVNLSWGNVIAEDGYKIERKLELFGVYSLITTTTIADITVYADTTVTPMNTYYYRVKAYNTSGDGGYTSDVSGTTPDVPPNPPTVLTCTVITSTRIDLSWDDNATNEIGYQIEKSLDGSSYYQLALVYRSITGYSDTTVEPQTTYYYKVRAYNSVGESAYAPAANGTTPDGPPNSPTTLTSTIVSTTQVDLGWSNVKRETGYKIERRFGSNGQYAQIGTVATDSLTYSDTTVTPYNTYYYRVKAFNEIGESPYYSPETSINTQVGSWSAIAAGYLNSFGIKKDGTLWAGGYFGWNATGINLPGDISFPTQVGIETDWLVVSGMNMSSIGSAGTHTLWLKTNGTIWVSGDNFYGALGFFTSTYLAPTPTMLPNPTGWSAVATGLTDSYGLRTNGTIWSWGGGWVSAGQLGLGEGVTFAGTPSQIGSNSNWVAIFGTNFHGLALQNNNTLWAWGWNNRGQLGLGNTVNRWVPTQVGSGWLTASGGGTDIDGGGHTIGIKTNGTLWAWGYNNYGQLGLGNAIDRTTPVQVGVDNNWISVSAGALYSVALKNNGTIWSWGRNESGQLGSGNYANRNVPAQAGTDADWSIIRAGGSHCIAIKRNNTLWGWGNNQYWQVGQGGGNTPTFVSE